MKTLTKHEYGNGYCALTASDRETQSHCSEWMREGERGRRHLRMFAMDLQHAARIGRGTPRLLEVAETILRHANS